MPSGTPGVVAFPRRARPGLVTTSRRTASLLPAGPPTEFRMMRYPIWFFRIIVFLLLFGFTVRNAETVTLRYYFGYEWQAPLVLIILLFFALGIAIGVMSCLGKLFRQRREILTYRKKYHIPD